MMEYLQSTHTKGRFCTPGSAGAEMHSLALELVHVNDRIITKTWYSCFSDTKLPEIVEEIDPPLILVAGVTTNTCVAAAAVDAHLRGRKTFILKDCVAAFNSLLATKTLEILRLSFGIQAIETSDLPGWDNTTATIEPVVKMRARLLYWVSGSIPSWRVMLALSFLKIPSTPKRLKVMSNPKETRSAQFLAINPRGKTPTLMNTDGQVVTESLAILQYLDSRYGNGVNGCSLIPELDEDQTARTRIIVRTQETENLHNVFEDIELLFVEDGVTLYHSHILDAYKNTLKELKIWDGYLLKSRYVACDRFTMADAAFYPCLAYLKYRGLDLAEWEGLRRYAKMMANSKEGREARPYT